MDNRACITCDRYIGCLDPKKSISYSCSKFIPVSLYGVGSKGKTEKQTIDAGFSLFDGHGLGTLATAKNPVAVLESLDQNYEFDLAKQVLDVVMSTDKALSKDLKVPDGDFPTAPNFYTFCTSAKYLKQTPYPWQILMPTIYLNEYCPRCTDQDYLFNTWKSTDSYLKIEKKVAFFEHGVCPHCKARRSKMVNKGLMHFYEEAALCLGQRSGKSANLGDVAAYLTHLEIKLQNVNEVYGLKSNSELHGTFVALTYGQAKDTLWDPYYNNLTDSPWFSSYHSMLDEIGGNHGEDLYRLKDSFVQYRHRKIKVYPAGPDKRVLRGRTRFMACLSADTLVSTSLGLVSIGTDLTGTKTHVGNKNFKILNWAETGTKKVYTVRLNNGLSIKATANHEMKTQRGWVRVDGLCADDSIQVSLGGKFPKKLQLSYLESYEPKFADIYRAVERLGTFELSDLQKIAARSVTPITSDLRKRGLISRHYYKGRTGAGGEARCYYKVSKSFNAEALLAESASDQSFTRRKCSFPSKMTPELAALLGYYVADGSYSKRAVEFYFATSIERRAEHFRKCFKAVFGVEPNRTEYRSKNDALMVRYAIGQNVMKEFLRYVGLDAVTSRDKEIPWSVLQAPRECASAFLAALYDCDGGVSKNYVWFATTSLKLGQQVQLLLQRFGILSDYKYKNELKSVRIREAYYQNLFASEIGFSTNELTVPTKRHRIDRLPDDKGFVYIPVTGKVFSGVEKVYDITVEDEDHGFTANGMVAHNSIDELGWFPNGAEAIKLVKLNADEVYKALSNSLRTVRAAANLLVEKGFDNIPTAYFINLSSPASIRDKIMELVRKSQDSAKIFGIQLPTWDANPTMPRSMFDEEFNRDPVGAMRDFGAQPPISNSPLLSNLDSIEGCASKKGQNPIRIKYETKKGKNGASTRFAKIAKLQDGAPPSVLAIDAGYSNNSFACSIGHLIDNKRVKLDLMVEVQPLPGIPLNYTLIFKHLLTPLIQRRNVRIIAADRWNSIKLLQDAEEEFDIKHVIYSLKYRDMVMFKDYFESGQLRYPKPEWTTDQITGYNQSEYPQTFKNHPVEHFVLQCITVQDTGATVTKGDRLTDDLVRSSMLCLNQLLNEENQELLNSAPDSAVRSSVNLQSSIVMRTSSGASGSTPTGTVKSSSGRVIGTARARAF